MIQFLAKFCSLCQTDGLLKSMNHYCPTGEILSFMSGSQACPSCCPTAPLGLVDQAVAACACRFGYRCQSGLKSLSCSLPTTTNKRVEVLRHLFAAHGIPEQVVTDNGPQFVADVFSSYLKGNGVKHIRTIPYHPSSNERFVQSFKQAKTSHQI